MINIYSRANQSVEFVLYKNRNVTNNGKPFKGQDPMTSIVKSHVINGLDTCYSKDYQYLKSDLAVTQVDENFWNAIVKEYSEENVYFTKGYIVQAKDENEAWSKFKDFDNKESILGFNTSEKLSQKSKISENSPFIIS